ncbi:Hypothetical protein MUW33_4084 [Mycobacterium canetti]|uniref:hypothetical protein n=1 Tax=Mycobacterium canetti TaxID=78331 RepID=UPI002D7938C8|nr:hypothetical protein [Mycobacterium canetti]WRO43982.1 Hypothetical protein MUW33_4084 [Mycobacterium canetti]
MKTLLEYFLKYFDVLYLDPRYHITNSISSGIATNNASLTLTGPILSWQLANDRGQMLLSVAPTRPETSDKWFSVSLVKQYLNGDDEIEYLSAAEEIEWVRENGDRVEQLFFDAVTSETTCELLRTLRRSNASKYWTQWREQEGLT